MFNFPFADDSPRLTADCLAVYDLVKAGKYEPYTSLYAYQELEATKNEAHRQRMLNIIQDYAIKIIDSTPEAERLAVLYVAGEAVPSGYLTDALHIAMTTVYALDFIVSLNFQHIARKWTIDKVAEINFREGFGPIGIYRPEEVLKL
jgi:hypothetical protein